MPKKPPANAEEVRLSADDADIVDLFIIRRSFNPDGSMRYVQVIGNADELEAFSRNLPVTLTPRNPEKQRVFALPRLIMTRMLGRPLDNNELVQPKNGKMGDCRRDNLEVTSRSALASGSRDSSWSTTGTKYVYPSERDRFYANVDGTYLGTFDTVEQAQASVKRFFELREKGMDDKEAARRLKGRARNANRVVID